MNTEIEILKRFFKKYQGMDLEINEPLPESGSSRHYYRLRIRNKSFVAVYNDNIKENTAFISFTKHFLKSGLNVPEIFAEEIDKNIYMLQDLGSTSLLTFLASYKENNKNSSGPIDVYKKVINHLPLFQVKAGKSLDYSVCYPRPAFDKQSMMWDLNYFKYYFLKLAQVSFDEQLLENDFHVFSDFLLQADSNYFLYRDFQSRNVMLIEGEPYFIDYQGGRRGALQYDIASVLFEAKTSLSADTRQLLLEYYLEILSIHLKFDRNSFLKYYYGFVYIRLMQAMGAYGFRGLYEKKQLFLQSIPNALNHLRWLRANIKLPCILPELEKVWDSLFVSEHIRHLAESFLKITVSINSFSYRHEIPVDETSHGGGFIFDCRLLNNPGQYEQYQNLTGLDKQVIDFLESDSRVDAFLKDIYSLVDKSVETYKEKGYTHLMVNFGCTGGKHRSVYSAEKLASHFGNKYPEIDVKVRHREIEMMK